MSYTTSTSESPTYQKTIRCLFLNKFDPTTITSESVLKSYYANIELWLDVSISGSDDGFNTDNLSSAVFVELNKSYPGIKAFDLYLLMDSYNKVFNTNSTSLVSKINNPFQKKIILKENFNFLSSIIIVFTNIYGEEDFTSIHKVKCEFKTSQGKSSFVYMLLPDVSLAVDTFKEALNDYITLSSKIKDDFEISIKNKNGEQIDNVSISILKDITIILIQKIFTFEELSNSIPVYKHKVNDEKVCKELLHDFYKPGIS